MTDRYEKIRQALAKGPTRGEWYWSDAYLTQDGRKTWSLIGDGGFGILSCDGEENSPQSINSADADWIVACDPDTIQALLEERDALRAEVSELRAARIAYASEFPETKDGGPDTGNIHKNIRLLKARAERLAEAVVRADLQIGDGHIEAARITLHDAMGATLSPPKQPVALAKEDNNE